MFASLLVVAIIGAIAWAGSAVGLGVLFGVVLPYVAVAAFFVGVIWRMVYWAKSPVPFAIPTTGGQERSLDFIKQAKWDCPTTTFGVVRRMFLEVVFFRSLFRNTCADVREFDEINNGPRTIYFSSKWLWVFSLLFHYCFLLVFIRHFRFFMDPVCPVITWIHNVTAGGRVMGSFMVLQDGSYDVAKITATNGNVKINTWGSIVSISSLNYPGVGKWYWNVWDKMNPQ